MSWIQLLGMGFIGSIGAMVDSGLGGASKFEMVMAMLQGFGIGVLGFAFVSVIAQLSPSVRALAAMFGSILSLTGGIVAARDSYEEGKYEQAAFRMLMGIFGCIMGARDYRNALRDCNVSVAVDETPNGGGGRGCVGDEDGINANDPSSYLQRALDNQGLDAVPSRLKEVWVEGDYKYTVRVHAGNSIYTDADYVYRVSRQSMILDEHGQGTGLEYLGTDGNWYHESVLTEFFRSGVPNPNFNEEAARMTHIPISGGN